MDDVVDKFTIATKDVELPRRYAVRGIYQNPSYDPRNGGIFSRLSKKFRKDVAYYVESAKVKNDKKTGANCGAMRLYQLQGL